MSKSKAEPKCVTLAFDLFDLPTAQHKAGLAGLLLQIRSMKDRRIAPEMIPNVEELTRTTARITFTRDSVQGLFDDLYDAKIVEKSSPTKWPNGAIKREEIQQRPIHQRVERSKSIDTYMT